MAENKRVKRFVTMDEVLLHPGPVIEHIEQLRTQIYHMQKKLRKSKHKKTEYDIVVAALDAGFQRMDEFLTPEERASVMETITQTTFTLAKKKYKK